MTLSRVHTPANAAGAAKLLLLNKRLVTQILSCTMLLYPQCWVTHLKPVSGLNRNPNPDHNVMQSRLPQKKSNGFFCGPCATFTPNSVEIGRVVTLHISRSTAYCNWPCLFLGVFVCGWVRYHDNSKLHASILTKLGL